MDIFAMKTNPLSLSYYFGPWFQLTRTLRKTCKVCTYKGMHGPLFISLSIYIIIKHGLTLWIHRHNTLSSRDFTLLLWILKLIRGGTKFPMVQKSIYELTLGRCIGSRRAWAAAHQTRPIWGGKNRSWRGGSNSPPEVLTQSPNPSELHHCCL